MNVQEMLPPRTMVTMTSAIVLLSCDSLVDQLVPLDLVMYHMVYGTPVGKAAEVTVVDKHVHLQLAAEVVVVGQCLLRIVAVYGIELYTTLTTPVDSLVEQFALANTPEDQLVTLSNEHAQCLNGERFLLTNLRILMLDYRPVEINCNRHYFLILSSSLLL